MQRLLLLCSTILMLLVGCQALGGQPQQPEAGANNPITQQGVVRWDSDPLAVIFRAEITGGSESEAFYALNRVPECTVYGDGRVVWTVERDSPVPQVLFAFLTPDQVENFILGLTVEGRIFTFEAGADAQLPSADAPVIDLITLNVNDSQHQVDSFTPDLPDNYFFDTLTACQSLSTEPTVFEPEAAWIRVQAIEYNNDKPSVFWETDASGLDLGTLANEQESRWIEGQNVRVIWRQLRQGALDMQFLDDNGTYQVVLQVPGVTIDAPPAPQ